jgi:hypothetical protein
MDSGTKDNKNKGIAQSFKFQQPQQNHVCIGKSLRNNYTGLMDCV